MSVRGESPVKRICDKVIRAFFEAYSIDYSVEQLAADALADHDTYYLSPRVYLKWKQDRSYKQYPWRQVASLNIVLKKIG